MYQVTLLIIFQIGLLVISNLLHLQSNLPNPVYLLRPTLDTPKSLLLNATATI